MSASGGLEDFVSSQRHIPYREEKGEDLRAVSAALGQLKSCCLPSAILCVLG